MQLQGERVVVKPVELSDAEALLKLEKENREFFQRFTGKRDEHFFPRRDRSSGSGRRWSIARRIKAICMLSYCGTPGRSSVKSC